MGYLTITCRDVSLGVAMKSEIEILKSKITGIREDDTGFPVRASVASFLFMVMPIDGQSHPAELDRLSRILSDDFDLNENETADLIAHAKQQANSNADMETMAQVLKAGLSKEDLLLLVSHMWEMVFADGRMHETEVVLVERVARLLDVPEDEVAKAMTY